MPDGLIVGQHAMVQRAEIQDGGRGISDTCPGSFQGPKCSMCGVK